MTMPTISVVMPSYNQAAFIGQAVESVLSQRGAFDAELIVVDGGSTDGTLDILRDYGERIRWISEPDHGQADALNKGLAMATGDVIGWLNSDDLYEPGSLAAVGEVFAAEPETQWLFGKVRIVDGRGREIRRWITAYKNSRLRRHTYARLLAENYISQMGVFWRRSAGEQVGPFRTELHLAMDYDYWLRLAARWPGRYVRRNLGCFRWYPTSKSGSRFVRQFREELDIACHHAAGRHRLAILHHYLMFSRTAIYLLMHLLRSVSGLLGVQGGGCQYRPSR